MCIAVTKNNKKDTEASTAAAASLHSSRPRGPSKMLKMAWMPIWTVFASLYIFGSLWFGIVGMTWASVVCYIVDSASGGRYEKMMTEFLNPKGGEPKGLMKSLSEAALNKKENYIHFASLLYTAIGDFGYWAIIFYLRNNDIGGLMLPLMVHSFWMGHFFIMGVNDLHYVAHTQISNNQKNHMFKYEILNNICMYIIEPMHGFLPLFWLDHHVKIHHKESNGPDDIQGVTFFERNFYNYICFVADIPLQWYVRGPLHHVRNGDKATAIHMVLAWCASLSVGISLTMWDVTTGVLLFWIPHLTRSLVFNSSNEYVQHALVDGRDGRPHDPANNSFLLLKAVPRFNYPRGIRSLPDNFEERWHAVHHAFPHKGMVGQAELAPKVKCNLVFDTDYISFKQAVMLRNTKKLAQWWCPGYDFGNDKYKVSQYAEADKKLDMKGREKLLESFFYPAYDLDDMGEWIYAPSFPFNLMELGPMQKHV